jgi:hypothetical protein
MLELSPSFEANVSHAFTVLSLRQEFDDIAYTDIARVKMLRDDDDWVLFLFHESVDSHLFVLVGGCGRLRCSLLQQLQKIFKTFVWTTKAS